MVALRRREIYDGQGCEDYGRIRGERSGKRREISEQDRGWKDRILGSIVEGENVKLGDGMFHKQDE
jgi:hypothetical protein